jgi:hypothetical protein
LAVIVACRRATTMLQRVESHEHRIRTEEDTIRRVKSVRFPRGSPAFARFALIGQGEKDGRLVASDAVFVALQGLEKKVEYRIYENEGHVISRKANVLDFWKRRLEFLDEWLDVAKPAFFWKDSLFLFSLAASFCAEPST